MNLKTMILGTMIMLLGGFIMADPSSSLGGLESLIVLIGLIIGVFGFFKKD
jgi:dipeptide/tripeptide permease